MLAHVFLKALPELGGRFWEPLVDIHPWLRFLPKRERPTFLREFAETVSACAGLGNNASLARLLHEWKATAAIYADPALAASQKRPLRGTDLKVAAPKGHR